MYLCMGRPDTCIKPRENKQYGWVYSKSIQDHYGGKGNKDSQIKEVEILSNTLHYNSERVMSFEKFLNNMQSMFTVFEDNNKLLTKAQNIWLLFQKVQIPSLTQVKNKLQVLYNLYQDEAFKFDFVTKSMAAEAYK